MRWARLIGSVFILGGGIVAARSANESVSALESCFKAARVADAICSKLPDDPALRLDCFQKTSSAQLECLQHVLSETPATPATPKPPSKATRSEPPAGAAIPPGQTGTSETPAGIPPAEKSNSPPKPVVGTNPPEPPRSTAAPTGAIRPNISPKTADVPVRPPAQTGTLETPDGIPPPEKSNAPPKPVVGTNPPEPPRSTAAPTGAIRPDIAPKTADVPVRPPAQTGTLETPDGIPPAEKSNAPLKPIVRTNPPEPPGSMEAPTGAIRPDISPKTADVPVRPTGTNWVISETTSPVDYSPLVTALIRSTSQVKDAPSALAVRCLRQRTELLVHTDGTWTATRGHELRVDYQVNDLPAVGLQWILSSDGKTATYKNDPVSFLQSLPDGARLKIDVADRASSHEATFQIDGWDVVRNKIGTACKWARTTDKTSSGKR
jgi:hypothetical protein